MRRRNVALRVGDNFMESLVYHKGIGFENYLHLIGGNKNGRSLFKRPPMMKAIFYRKLAISEAVEKIPDVFTGDILAT